MSGKPFNLTYKNCVRCNAKISEHKRGLHWCEKCYSEFNLVRDDPTKRRKFCSQKFVVKTYMFLDEDDD